VYGGAEGGTDFVSSMRSKAAGTDEIDVVADQWGSPTYVGELVDALLRIAEGTIPGPVLHAANRGGASRYDQAVAVFELLGADAARVRPVGSDRHPRPAPRPTYSVLSGDRSTAAGLPPLRHWRDALAEALGSSPVA
jgi:dTDP-4-dehydrorhamnose reductase